MLLSGLQDEEKDSTRTGGKLRIDRKYFAPARAEMRKRPFSSQPRGVVRSMLDVLSKLLFSGAFLLLACLLVAVMARELRHIKSLLVLEGADGAASAIFDSAYLPGLLAQCIHTATSDPQFWTKVAFICSASPLCFFGVYFTSTVLFRNRGFVSKLFAYILGLFFVAAAGCVAYPLYMYGLRLDQVKQGVTFALFVLGSAMLAWGAKSFIALCFKNIHKEETEDQEIERSALQEGYGGISITSILDFDTPFFARIDQALLIALASFLSLLPLTFPLGLLLLVDGTLLLELFSCASLDKIWPSLVSIGQLNFASVSLDLSMCLSVAWICSLWFHALSFVTGSLFMDFYHKIPVGEALCNACYKAFFELPSLIVRSFIIAAVLTWGAAVAIGGTLQSRSFIKTDGPSSLPESSKWWTKIPWFIFHYCFFCPLRFACSLLCGFIASVLAMFLGDFVSEGLASSFLLGMLPEKRLSTINRAEYLEKACLLDSAWLRDILWVLFLVSAGLVLIVAACAAIWSVNVIDMGNGLKSRLFEMNLKLRMLAYMAITCLVAVSLVPFGMESLSVVTSALDETELYEASVKEKVGAGIKRFLREEEALFLEEEPPRAPAARRSVASPPSDPYSRVPGKKTCVPSRLLASGGWIVG